MGNHGSADAWVVKLDPSGTMVWQNALGGSSFDEGASIDKTTDGGYVIAGRSNSSDGDVSNNFGDHDLWVVRLDGAGMILWEKSYGGTAADRAHAIRQTSDGGFVAAGITESNDGDVTGNHGGEDCWVIKIDSIGNLLWQSALGGSEEDEAHSVAETSDGGFIIAGHTVSDDGDVSGNHGSTDAWVAKLDGAGNLVWQNTLGGTAADVARYIEETSDGGFILSGAASSTNGDVIGNTTGTADSWIIRMDPIGTVLWQKTYGGSGTENGQCIRQTADGGFIVAGDAGSNNGDVSGNNGAADFWIFQLDSLGNLLWQKALGGSSIDLGHHINITSDGAYIVVGWAGSSNGDVVGSHGNLEAWVVKLMPVVNSIPENPNTSFHISPNPNNGNFVIQSDRRIDGTITVLDLTGSVVHRSLMHGTHKQIILPIGLQGIYLLVVQDAAGSATQKIVLR